MCISYQLVEENIEEFDSSSYRNVGKYVQESVIELNPYRNLPSNKLIQRNENRNSDFMKFDQCTLITDPNIAEIEKYWQKNHAIQPQVEICRLLDKKELLNRFFSKYGIDETILFVFIPSILNFLRTEASDL